MGRNLSPALSQELANLEKDGDSRKNAMKALKLYVKDLDSKAIPLFLAKVSATKDAGSSFGEHTISLYEVLVRVHGPKIVSQLDNIMSTIIRTLTTSGGSFPLQQACSKVVPAIARYAIQPTTPEDKKRSIIHSLCKPLSDSLLCSQESLSCGAALCLKALVDCDNWRFASNEMVNEVCLKLTGALKDKMTQTNSHMGLVISLAKRNSFVVEAYARLLVNAGLHIVNCGLAEQNSQKRLTAIQMVHSLMKCLDIRSIFSELEVIIEEMEKCQSDDMPYVKGAAFEALQTAKKLLSDKGSKMTDSDVVSVTGSNFSRSNNSRRRHMSSSGSRSPLSRSGSRLSESPESQTLDSFADFESMKDSPISADQASCNNGNHIRKNVNRKLWRENGYVDVSLKDGLFSELTHEGYRPHLSSECNGQSDSRINCPNGFPGFALQNPVNGGHRSQTPSPQRTSSHINMDNVKIFTTPRKLLRSLQDEDDDEFSEYFENQFRRFRSPIVKYANGHLDKEQLLDDAINAKDGCELWTNSESTSSSEDVTMTGDFFSGETLPEGERFSPKVVKNSKWKTAFMLVFVFLVLSGVVASVLWSNDVDNGHSLIPT